MVFVSFTMYVKCWSGFLVHCPSSKWSLLLFVIESIKYIYFSISCLLGLAWIGNCKLVSLSGALTSLIWSGIYFPSIVARLATVVTLKNSRHVLVSSHAQSGMFTITYYIIIWSFSLCVLGVHISYNFIFTWYWTNRWCRVFIHPFGIYVIDGILGDQSCGILGVLHASQFWW